MKNNKTSKHTEKKYEKPASIGKHAKIVGNLGGRPPKNQITWPQLKPQKFPNKS